MALDWWTNDKVALDQSLNGAFALMRPDSIKNSARRLGQFLARVVLPRMEWADEAEWLRLLGWLQELRNLGVGPTSALPFILLGRPAESEAVAKTIAADINSDQDDEVAAAARAVRYWIHLAAIGRAPVPPPSLMSALIERVVFRRKAGINSCLAYLAYLIVERQEALTPYQAALLTSSLNPWHYATALTIPEGSAGDYYEAERPAVRAGIRLTSQAR